MVPRALGRDSQGFRQFLYPAGARRSNRATHPSPPGLRPASGSRWQRQTLRRTAGEMDTENAGANPSPSRSATRPVDPGRSPSPHLRFLTDALYAVSTASRPDRSDRRTVAGAAAWHRQRETTRGNSRLSEELIPCPPDDDNFEPQTEGGPASPRGGAVHLCGGPRPARRRALPICPYGSKRWIGRCPSASSTTKLSAATP